MHRTTVASAREGWPLPLAGVKLLDICQMLAELGIGAAELAELTASGAFAE